MKIKAALALEAQQPLSIHEVTLAEDLQPNEVLVKNIATGLCHSDILIRDLDPEIGFVPRPSVLGHEGAGIVERVGSAVTNVEAGDHVIMSYHSCGECPSCDADLNPYCVDFMQDNVSGLRLNGTRALEHATIDNISGSYHQQSAFAEYSIATDRNTIKVDKDLPLEYLGPLGCGFMTGAGAIINKMKPTKGSTIAVFGAGAVGFAAIYAAKALGCAKIIAIDLHDSRLELAKAFGATDVINASQGDAAEAVREMHPLGVEYVFEATGVIAVMNQAASVLAPGGHYVQGGMTGNPDARLEVIPTQFAFGQDLSGIFMGHAKPRETIQFLLDAIQNKEFPIEKLVRFYDFEDVNQAIEDSLSGKTIKAILKFN